MYLKCVRANGFKSFADKTEIDVKPGITGIVGPNGSGKSNIVDAVRWVLGEQSVKELRGTSSMQDVVFSGSKTRSAASRASVSLTFDNSDHYLNSDFTEVEIKRVLYKTGENEYYINNVKVRLKDVTNLFLDTGAGKESFNIIGQGEVGNVINSKPEDRRVIFEEAAGVLKYKKRKEESNRKLDRTKDNLERIDLLINELESNLEPLKSEVEKAKKYLNYKEELKNIEVALISNDIRELNIEYQENKDKKEMLEKELEDITVTSNSDDSILENLKLQGLKLDSDIEEVNTKINSITNELSFLRSQRQITIERKKYEVDDQKLANNIISLKEEVLNIKKELSLVEKDIIDNKASINEKSLRSMELIKKNKDLKEERDSNLNTLNNINKDIMNIDNRISIIEDNINNDSSLPLAVKSTLNNVRLKGVHNTIGKLIDAEEKYITAINTTLGGATNYIVVDNEEAAKEAINYLKDNKLGRATFFPLNVIKGRDIDEETLTKVKEVKGFINTADKLVTYDKKYEDIITNQLGGTIVVDDIDTLNKIGKLINYKYKVVSLDGEILYTGGAITGGKNKNNNSLLSLKYEMENLKDDRVRKESKLKEIESVIKKLNKDLEELSNKIEESQRENILLQEKENVLESNKNKLESDLNNKESELKGTENVKASTLDSELDKILKDFYKAEEEQEKLNKELSELKSKKASIQDDIEVKEKEYRTKNIEVNRKQNELKNSEVKLGKIEVKLDNLLLTLNESYNLTYEKGISEYELDMDAEEARIKVNNLKSKINELGEVNTGAIDEYDRINTRYEFLSKQKEDLEMSIKGLLEVISEMDEIVKNNFKETFDKIQEAFKQVFKTLFKGGEGVLELTNPDDLLNTGILIKAVPPGKNITSIGLLSGGEKTLTAISLLFAILLVKPVPFVILDEVEAALDEANVDTFGKYVRSVKDKSQFITITHKERTMEYADLLYGVTMQESGVTKMVSVKLEDK